MKRCNRYTRILFIYGVIQALSWYPPPCRAQTFHPVRWIPDGDTIVLEDGRHVRYIGIDAPEIGYKKRKAQPLGVEARDYNRKLAGSQSIRMESDLEKQDRYGRVLAYVYLKDGRFLNAMLISAGYAWCLPKPPNTTHESLLLQCQQKAMGTRKGIWNHIPDKEQMKLIGNRKSKRFHLSTCKFGRNTGKTNRVLFSSRWEAFYSGFAPCYRCEDRLLKGGN